MSFISVMSICKKKNLTIVLVFFIDVHTIFIICANFMMSIDISPLQVIGFVFILILFVIIKKEKLLILYKCILLKLSILIRNIRDQSNKNKSMTLVINI